MMSYDKPLNDSEQTLVYKTVAERIIELTFLPPIIHKYEYAPVWILIPGGGWHSETRESMIEFVKNAVEKLRKDGMAVAAIDYRVTKEEGIVMEDIISDCFDAARYISHFKETLKVDEKRIGVTGHSAGGHLALMLSYAPHDMFVKNSVLNDQFNVKVVAALSPATIMYDVGTSVLGFTADSAYRGCNTVEERIRTSPYSYVSKLCPPTMLCAGTSDRLVYCNSSELLYKKLLENGVNTKLILSLGGGHCYEAMHDGIDPSPNNEEIQDTITEFIMKFI